jgi:hypothetical protein
MNIHDFENLHFGETGIIVGNGPNLTEIDLEFLRDYPTIATGSIGHVYNDTNWRPTYFVSLHDLKKEKTYNNLIDNHKSICFINDQFSDLFMKWNVFPLKKTLDIRNEGQLSSAYQSFKSEKAHYSKQSLGNFWSFDISQYVIGMHSYYVMAQIFAYLGFSQIFLIGFDPKKYDTNPPLEFEISNYKENKIGYLLDSLGTDSPIYHIRHGLEHMLAARGYVAQKSLSHFTEQYETQRFSYIVVEEMMNSHKLASVMFEFLGIDAYVVGSQYLPYQHVHPSEFESVIGNL